MVQVKNNIELKSSILHPCCPRATANMRLQLLPNPNPNPNPYSSRSTSLQPILVQEKIPGLDPANQGKVGSPTGLQGNPEGNWSPPECLQPLPSQKSPLGAAVPNPAPKSASWEWERVPSPATSRGNTDPLQRTT